ncbi:phosphotransferase [Streptomyces griseosporeus]|uniref:phosphotransferase n=1 Tax=Streptomyces griseosporeus TaxID=1910 RepID=UPI0036FDDBB4
MGLARPAFGCPWTWAVSGWLGGEVATVEAPADSRRAATDLAAFLTALRRCDPGDLCEPAARDDPTLRLTPPPATGRTGRRPERPDTAPIACSISR